MHMTPRSKMNELPSHLVSVIIPCFNGEEYIEGTIRSALEQTHDRLEVLVADDGSTDLTLDILHRLAENDRRLRIIQGPHSGHPGIVRNRALSRATGDYVAFLDSDDLWIRNKIEVQLAAMADTPEASVCFGPVHVQDADQDPGSLEESPPRHRASKAFRCPEEVGDSGFASLLTRQRSIHMSSVFLRRSLAEEVGMFSEAPSLRRHQNNDYVLRAYRQGVPLALEDIYVVVRRRSGSASDTSSWENVFAVLEAVERRERLSSVVHRKAWSVAWLVRGEIGLLAETKGDWRRPMFQAWGLDPTNLRRIPALIAACLPQKPARTFYQALRNRVIDRSMATSEP